jgi:hypothetical protein
MKRKLQLSGIFTLLLLVFIIGLKGTFDGYYGFYYENKTYQKPWYILLVKISPNHCQSVCLPHIQVLIPAMVFMLRMLPATLS